MKNHIIFLIIVSLAGTLRAQSDSLQILRFSEYLGYVKKFHPVARQAELKLSEGQANLMKARGGFDPKIEVDYDRKQFKSSEYYDRLNATFKIPTWYGLEFKGSFEQNDGLYLNPDEQLPVDGLYSAGITVSLARGLWSNERMAALKQARLFREQARAERDLQVNTILFQASIAYFEWLQAYRETEIYGEFLRNAQRRFDAIKKSAISGVIAAIDTVEAKIVLQDRSLNLEQAEVRLSNKSLELSNFIWLEGNIPVELQPQIVPDIHLEADVDRSLEVLGKPLDSFELKQHPKVLSLDYKLQVLEVERNLKVNQLLPRVDLEYNFLTETPAAINSFATGNYKGGISLYFPLFLRKERGELKLARVKLETARYELDNIKVTVRNKVRAVYRELQSFELQNSLVEDILGNTKALLAAEERRFAFGESSVFLINSRESKLLETQLKQNSIRNKYLTAKAKLFNSMAINPENLE